MRLLTEDTRIAIVGMTGRVGQRFLRRMLSEGTPVVAGINPVKAGECVLGIPVVESAARAAGGHRANTALVVVPPLHVLSAVSDLAKERYRVVSVYAEGVPVHDAMRMIALCRETGTTLFGPNSAGMAVPGVANLSDIAAELLHPGSVAIVSKSGTLAYEVLVGLAAHGIGSSGVYCVGGDPFLGTTMAEVVAGVTAQEETEAVVLVGEIGGDAEYEVAELWPQLAGHQKPLVSLVTGLAAPPGKRMGHAGALLRSAKDDASSKQAALSAAGAIPADYITDVADLVAQAARHPHG